MMNRKMQKMTTRRLMTVMMAVPFVFAGGVCLAQDDAGGGDHEPSLDDLLGTGDDNPDAPADAGDDAPATPEIDRALERRLSGEEAADQFAQAVQDMTLAAARLGEDEDAGIDTQRLQDEIILRLEQIIASAQKSESQSSSSSSGQPEQQQARQADRGGQPQPGQQPGQGQGEQEGEGEQPGQQPGAGEGEGQEGQRPGQGNPRGSSPSEGGGQRGDVRNADLSMEELREGEWGNLPPRLRDELAESLGESFNPVYRAVTEAYYRRIAELSQQQAEGE